MSDEMRHHLEQVTAYLADKFPDADHDHVAEVVDDVFQTLDADAKVADHLPALTQHHAQERLLAEAAGDVDADADAPVTAADDSSVGPAAR